MDVLSFVVVCFAGMYVAMTIDLLITRIQNFFNNKKLYVGNSRVGYFDGRAWKNKKMPVKFKEVSVKEL